MSKFDIIETVHTLVKWMLIHHFRVNIMYLKIALGSFTDTMKVGEMRNDKTLKLMSVNFFQYFAWEDVECFLKW